MDGTTEMKPVASGGEGPLYMVCTVNSRWRAQMDDMEKV